MTREEATFCDDCPMKGRCQTEIVGYKHTTIQGSRLGSGAFIARLGVLLDKEMRPSEIIYIPPSYTPKEAIGAVQQCEYPEYTEKGIWLFKKHARSCRAIGNLVCNDNQLVNLAWHAL